MGHIYIYICAPYTFYNGHEPRNCSRNGVHHLEISAVYCQAVNVKPLLKRISTQRSTVVFIVLHFLCNALCLYSEEYIHIYGYIIKNISYIKYYI